MIENVGLIRLSGEHYDSFLKSRDVREKLTAKADNESGSTFPVYRENLTKRYVLIPKFFAAIPGGMEPFRFPVARVGWGKLLSWNDKFPLKDYQQEAVDKLLQAWTVKSGALLRADCGTGKTVMALNAVSRWEPGCVVILVDQNNIAKQWKERIEQFLPGSVCKIFGGEFEDIDTCRKDQSVFKIVLAQSLMRRDWLDEQLLCTILVVDEAHVFSAPCFAGSIANIHFGYSLALTATPERKDNLTWVFTSILGDTIVDVSAASNLGDVHIIQVPHFSDSISRYRVWWCKREKMTTWENKCTGCHLYHLYPNCGGKLPATDRMILVDLIKEFAMSEEYQNVLKPVIATMYRKKRQVMVFSHLREHLKLLYSWACHEFGENACGIYMGSAKKSDKAKRDEAMGKQITFCTYGIANKALDVPHKDTAILSTPISDVRQAKGRVERFAANKPVPVIIDFSVPNVDIFRGLLNKRIKTYKQAGNTIRYAVERDNNDN